MATERRLIDVSKVIDQMQKCIDESPYERDSIAAYTFGAIIECLKKEPTVDAVEVVHGRWAHLGGDEWCCTACGEVIHTEGSWEKPSKKYCNECGAKMDGERRTDHGQG